jgi:hypothetical protein
MGLVFVLILARLKRNAFQGRALETDFNFPAGIVQSANVKPEIVLPIAVALS